MPSAKPDPNLYYTLDDISELFCIGRAYAVKIVNSVGFPCYKEHNNYKIPIKEFNEWLLANMQKTVTVGMSAGKNDLMYSDTLNVENTNEEMGQTDIEDFNAKKEWK